MKWPSSLLSLGLIAGLAAGAADAQRRSAGFPSGTIVDLSYPFETKFRSSNSWGQASLWMSQNIVTATPIT